MSLNTDRLIVVVPEEEDEPPHTTWRRQRNDDLAVGLAYAALALEQHLLPEQVHEIMG